MKEIPLSQGKVALVDDEDYDRLASYRWHYFYTKGREYASRSVWKDKRSQWVFMHREIMNTPAGMETHHWQSTGLDNRKSNLYVCTRQEHQEIEAAKQKPRHTSKYRCVSRLSVGKYQYWQANKKLHGVVCYIGSFPYTSDGEIRAAHAVDDFCLEHFGRTVNFPSGVAP